MGDAGTNPKRASVKRANGLAIGIISYVVIHLARGRGRQVPWAAYVLAVLLTIRFVYIGGRT